MGEYLNWSYETYWVREKNRELEVCLIDNNMNNNLQDFQKGNNSNMNSMDRLMYHQIWLKLMHQEMRQRIQSKIKVEEAPVVGFIRD